MDQSQSVSCGGGNSKLKDIIDGAGLDPQRDDENENVDLIKQKKKKTKYPSRCFVEGSIDCVCMINNTLFLSRSDSGLCICNSMSLWSKYEKKAIFPQPLAHGTEKESINELTQDSIIKARRITLISGLLFSNLFCSGSWDSNFKTWKLIKGGQGKYEIKKLD
ncbi:uncharacterized protein MELLADRAFT_111959 [Melampsora larici-populina 98AG31]|uniref:Uncharacterized protein n=1 Tax=Melampsora larici-populina (strain 98AG31 / pathotype 3-4-7) TaxID=747676 RepID=F4S4X4_MELLP|nr:uncharacterized protein MELLADRAFT_111959 [Melampsora larici-populina 98AG31]EGG00306.1 hypothetical protein MELLADRAFT_111959 [Melampsora larici-populina 98AG31]